MLDPILNINPNERYKSGSKSPVNFYSIQKNTEEKNRQGDSARFSPLATLLSKINWQIINVSYPSRSEIKLHFSKDQLEFITTIDFNKLYTEPYQDFTVIKKKIVSDKHINYKLNLKIKKETVTTFSEINPLEISSIQELFSRVLLFSYENNTDTDYTNPVLFLELLNGIEDEIHYEFNSILTAIYTFISAKQKNKIRNNFTLNTNQNYPIIIQRVSITGQ
ncbi:MAG: hypothetical protein V3V16_15880 [Melioribacteraceae bacterium]